MSKKQTTAEMSSFGSEFISMKQCCEYLHGLRYKLQMMGILVNGPCYIQGDNPSVLANTSNHSSMLKKKSQRIAYHFVREGVAWDEWYTSYANTHDNGSDLLNKQLPFAEKEQTVCLESVVSHLQKLMYLYDCMQLSHLYPVVCLCLVCSMSFTHMFVGVCSLIDVS